jgi:pyruvate/2-oxoglutarate dehydrogenase complex dihydrolipoamide dehydrogenase (E3) component
MAMTNGLESEMSTHEIEAALAWRDFVVSDYSDAGQEAWLAGHGIDLLRGSGRLAGPCAVEVDGVRYTADDTSWPPAPGRSSRRSGACASSRGCGRAVRRPP